MSALKVKINALEELIETENTTSKTVGDELFKWERHCWPLPPRNGVKNIKPCAQYIKFSKKQTPREFKNVQLCIDETLFIDPRCPTRTMRILIFAQLNLVKVILFR